MNEHADKGYVLTSLDSLTKSKQRWLEDPFGLGPDQLSVDVSPVKIAYIKLVYIKSTINLSESVNNT